MDVVRSQSPLLHVEHRHGDRWIRLEPTPEHDAAEADPERRWGLGRLFRCSTCEEEVKVDLDRDEMTRA